MIITFDGPDKNKYLDLVDEKRYPAFSAVKHRAPGLSLISSTSTYLNAQDRSYPRAATMFLELATLAEYYGKVSQWFLPHMTNMPGTKTALFTSICGPDDIVVKYAFEQKEHHATNIEMMCYSAVKAAPIVLTFLCDDKLFIQSTPQEEGRKHGYKYLSETQTNRIRLIDARLPQAEIVEFIHRSIHEKLMMVGATNLH